MNSLQRAFLDTLRAFMADRRLAGQPLDAKQRLYVINLARELGKKGTP